MKKDSHNQNPQKQKFDLTEYIENIVSPKLMVKVSMLF